MEHKTQAEPIELLPPTWVPDAQVHFSAMLDLSDVDHWCFIIKNNEDQQVNITLIGGMSAVAAEADAGATYTINAHSHSTIVTDSWTPFAGCQYQFLGVPNMGNLEIIGWVQFRKTS